MTERYLPQEGDIVRGANWHTSAPVTVDRVTTSGKSFVGVADGIESLYHVVEPGFWVKVGPKPVLRELWINLYPHNISHGVHSSLRDADLYAGDLSNRLAVLHLFPDGTTKIDWLDGQGEQ